MWQSKHVTALTQDKFCLKHPSDNNHSPTFSTSLELEKYHAKISMKFMHMPELSLSLLSEWENLFQMCLSTLTFVCPWPSSSTEMSPILTSLDKSVNSLLVQFRPTQILSQSRRRMDIVQEFYLLCISTCESLNLLRVADQEHEYSMLL